MENKTEATLDGVYYEGEYLEHDDVNTLGEPLDLNKIIANKKLGLSLTKAEEKVYAAAQARLALYGWEE